MSLGSTLSGTLEQLNILEDFKKIGKPYTHLQIFNHELESILSLDMTDRNAMYVIVCQKCYTFSYKWYIFF